MHFWCFPTNGWFFTNGWFPQTGVFYHRAVDFTKKSGYFLTGQGFHQKVVISSPGSGYSHRAVVPHRAVVIPTGQWFLSKRVTPGGFSQKESFLVVLVEKKVSFLVV